EVPLPIPKGSSRSIPYGIEWEITIHHALALGVTPVCIGQYPQGETLLWVASGGATGWGDPNWILIYNLNTRTLVDSFLQQTTTPLGYRDMCFYNGYVYAGTEQTLHVIDPVTKQVVGSYQVTGMGTNIIRALTDNNVEPYLWTTNWANPIYRFPTTGGAATHVATNSYSIYGFGYDPRGFVWGSSQTAGAELVKYRLPTFDVMATSAFPELEGGLAGGCEMWRDTFLLYLGQCNPNDKVFCVRLYGLTENDTRVSMVIAPTTIIPYQKASIKAVVLNVGTNLQNPGIPVKMRITGPNGYLYEDLDQTTTRALVQGDTQIITFVPQWQAPMTLGEYTLKAWTELPGDQRPQNDTFTTTIIVTNWISYANWGGPFYWYPTLGGEKATRFYPLEFGVMPPVTIDSIEALFYKTAIRDSVFKFKIYDSDGTTLLYESGEITVTGTGQLIPIIHAVVPPVQVSGTNFYIALWCRSDSQPNLLSDRLPRGRSFLWHTGKLDR
ncbi:MAG: hypothetical protein RMJ65_06760, partial [candidate division WOR-3 bacterium]|nr:hypothetical protein [candidate division WOR-3 bacterium]